MIVLESFTAPRESGRHKKRRNAADLEDRRCTGRLSLGVPSRRSGVKRGLRLMIFLAFGEDTSLCRRASCRGLHMAGGAIRIQRPSFPPMCRRHCFSKDRGYGPRLSKLANGSSGQGGSAACRHENAPLLSWGGVGGLIATLCFWPQEITTPALGAPPLRNQEGSYQEHFQLSRRAQGSGKSVRNAAATGSKRK
jgi:hypothetical protein